jgi:hypothetical protein
MGCIEVKNMKRRPVNSAQKNIHENSFNNVKAKINNNNLETDSENIDNSKNKGENVITGKIIPNNGFSLINQQPIQNVQQEINDKQQKEQNITVEILFNEDQKYSKEVNKETRLSLILDDFKRDNSNNFSRMNFIEYFYQDVQLTNLNQPISNLLQPNDINDNKNNSNNNNQIKITAKIYGLLNLADFIYLTIKNNTNYLGKVIKDSNSIMLIVFNRYERCCSFDCFDENNNNYNDPGTMDLISMFNDYSSMCNGNNHLFISGGLNPKSFFDIDLVSNKIKRIKQDMLFPKTFHSMIYIPNEYVFIVGGSDKTVFYYSTVHETFHEWIPLQYERLEPALCLVNERFLYVFSNMRNKSKITFEYTDLRGKAEWMIIVPKEKTSLSLNQTFFGCVYNSKNNSVIFFGGSSFEKNSDLIAYDIQNSELKSTLIPFKETHLNEKTFIPFNDKYSFLIPNFNHFRSSNIITFNNITEKFKSIEFEMNNKFLLKTSKYSKNTCDAFYLPSILADNAPPSASLFPKHVKTCNEGFTNNNFAFNSPVKNDVNSNNDTNTNHVTVSHELPHNNENRKNKKKQKLYINEPIDLDDLTTSNPTPTPTPNY